MSYASPASHRGASTYTRVGVESAALSASPHQLITMLFDGAADAIAVARYHMVSGRVAQKGMAISKAINIVENGLKAGLDPVAGGPEGERLVQNLDALYAYVIRLLLKGNLDNDFDALDEASRLLDTVGSAWKEMGAQAAAGEDAAGT